MAKSTHKAWAGRMAVPTDALVESFTTSYPFDCRLYRHDIAGSIAHCGMLAKQRIIPEADARKIIRTLEKIAKEFDEKRFVPSPSDEDIHMAVERRLIELAGPVGGKLHTARSRNDQVALDLRLFLRDEIAQLRDEIRALIEAFAELANAHRKAIMPGYTHLQPAQPVLFAHHLLAYGQMLKRDEQRLADCARRMNVLPLGSGALAGTTFPIDRAFVAKMLGFDSVSENSMDAVSDRDFAAEFLADGALLGVHLSRFSEDLILWSSQAFGFVELPDAFATGSSIMPQKKNPDVAELIRGKSGRLLGNWVRLLTAIKGLPMTYNRDLQEDKEPVFDTLDTLHGSLQVLTAMLPHLTIREDRMAAASTAGFTLATELADYLSSKGIPFRESHEIVGKCVRWCIANDRKLEDLSVDELRPFSAAIGTDVRKWLTAESAVVRRRAPGGTSPANLDRQIRNLRK